MYNPSRAVLPTLLLTLLTAGMMPREAAAQRGYLFNKPRASFALRLGAGVPYANDDLFQFFRNELTLDRGDFRGFAAAGDIGVRVTKQLDVVLGVAYEGSSHRSEFRDWVDNNDLPIEQKTTFYRVPVTLSAKLYPLSRGRSLSQHAWVPNKFTPYLMAGGGATIYGVEQVGDFVDYQTLQVFNRRFESNGAGLSGHVGAGAEYWVTSHVGVAVDGRYNWASAGLGYDFSDFDRINLNGFQVTTGVAFRL